MFNSGGPMLMVPYIHKGPLDTHHVGIAWDGSRLAARALRDAMPFLMGAKAVTVIAVNEEAGEASSDQLVGHLARRGIAARVQRLATERGDVQAAILSIAAESNMGLLVMGGYGHSRLQERMLGGVTRGMFELDDRPGADVALIRAEWRIRSSVSVDDCLAIAGTDGRNPHSLMHLNVQPAASRYRFGGIPRRPEIVMAELPERNTSSSSQPAANAEAEASRLNQNALEFMFGAQRMMFEEFIFFTDEMLERTRTEMHLFTEFVAKMAGAHSVKDVKTMCQECGQHQLDFLRRDSERLFRHGERMIATTSNLISGRR